MRALLFAWAILLISGCPTASGNVPAKVAGIVSWNCAREWGYESDRDSLYAITSLPDYDLISRRCITEDNRYGFVVEEAGEIVFVAIFSKDPTYMSLNEKSETYGALKTNEDAWVEILTHRWLILKPYILHNTSGGIELELLDESTMLAKAKRTVNRKKELVFVIPDFTTLKPTGKACEKDGLYLKSYEDKENNQEIILLGEDNEDLFMLIVRTNPLAEKFFRKQSDGQWTEVSYNDVPLKFDKLAIDCASERKRPH